MNKKTRTVAVGGMAAAVAVTILFIASMLPTGELALSAIAGLAIAMAALECGKVGAILVYTAVSVLAFLILPSKSPALMFTAFFGIYPVVKLLAERAAAKSRVFEWIIKIAFFNTAAILMWMLASVLVIDIGIIGDSAILWIILAAGNGVFILYDIGFTGLISVYIQRFYNKKGRSA